jgi:hypothetical protein
MDAIDEVAWSEQICLATAWRSTAHGHTTGSAIWREHDCHPGLA